MNNSENNPKISIIVPVYKVEKYLNQCLDSILGQTLKDIEIIIIDEGDLDVCREIIDSYEQKDSRIVAVHKKQGGYGASVNYGINMARGEYIGIVESDDWIESDMFEILYSKAKEQNVDVVKSNFYDYWGKDCSISEFREILPKKDYGKAFCPIENQEIFLSMPCIWSAIYKRDFIIKNKIDFTKTAGGSFQDTGFNFKVWACAESVYLIKDAFVHYRLDSENSSINSAQKIFCICDEIKEIEDFLEKNPNKKENLELMKNRLKYSIYTWNFNRVSGKGKRKFLQFMSREFREIIKSKKINKEQFSQKKWEEFNFIAKHPIIYWINYKLTTNY